VAQCAEVVTTPSPRSGRAIFVGRRRELDELEAALDDVASARGGVFLLTGEPGIGKTRLADELGRTAAARGLAVHWGRAWEAGGAPPYWPFTQALRGIVRTLAPEFLDPFLGGALGGLLPELRRGRPAATDDRFELFDAVTAFLRSVATAAPKVIVLDDLHAADPSSLQLLHFLVRDVRSMALLVIGTYRDAEARLATELGRRLTQVAREATVIPLRRLDEREVGELVAETTGAAASPDRVTAIFRRTEGNPLFLRELLRLSGTTGSQPDGIREVVRARLVLLPPPARALLEAAAVLGREFWIDPLSAITGIAEVELRGRLGPAADAGIVEPLEHTGTWRFTHVLLREGLYDALAQDRRRSLHAAAVTELRHRVGDPPLAELAHHALHAIPEVAVADAAAIAIRAAARALDLLAFEDAAAMLARTLERVDQPDGDPRITCEVLVALGGARIRASEIAPGKATCRRAIELARTLGDGELFARGVLACAYEYTPGVHDTDLIAMLDEALALLPPGDSAVRARCLAQLAAERQPEPDTQAPIELARRAIGIARRVGDPDTLRFTLASASMAMLVYADVDERVRVNEEALHLALAAGDKRLALRAHLFLANDRAELGDRAGVAAHVRGYEALADELRHAAFRWVTVGLHAADALMEGRFDDATRGFERARAMMVADETSGASMAMLPVALCRATERYDDLPGIEATIRARFGAMRHAVGSCLGEMVIAQLHGRAGDTTRAASQLAAVRAHPVFEAMTEPAWLALLVEPIDLLGDTALAARLYPLLLPRADRFFNLGPLGPSWEPPYARSLGLLAHVLGRFDDAVTHLARAEERTAAIGMRAHLARLRYELARALLRRQRPGDRERALEVLDCAHALAEELSQRDVLPPIRSLIAATEPSGDDRARAVTPSPAGAAFSLRREGDYWAVTAGERTVRLRDSRGMQLLDRLVASPDVELHALQLISPGDDGDPGDAGTVLDATAIQDYRRRLLDLREEVDAADDRGDLGRAERAREEIEVLTQELARAVGLGGRERRVGGAAERARTTVQKRLRTAIQRIEDQLPELGRSLDQSIHTGAFCGYFPGGRPRGRRR